MFGYGLFGSHGWGYGGLGWGLPLGFGLGGLGMLGWSMMSPWGYYGYPGLGYGYPGWGYSGWGWPYGGFGYPWFW